MDSRESRGRSEHSARHAQGWRQRARTVGRSVFWLALLAAVLPRGAVTPVSVASACVLASLSACLGMAALPERAGIRRIHAGALLLAAFLVAFLLVQAASFEGNPLANGVWQAAAALVGATGSSISVDPAATVASIPLLVLPFLMFAAALSLFGSDRDALDLLSGLGILGALFAAFGLLQVAFFRDSLLFYEKTAYLDSLTSVFVNRNTAGTLLGVASLLWLGLLLAAVSPARVSVSRSAARHRGASRRLAQAAAAGLFVCLLALFLTKSRGAIFSTALAMALVLPLLYDSIASAVRGVPAGSISPWAKAAAAVAVVFAAVALLGGQALLRMETRGIDLSRLCVYQATFRGFLDNWIAGVGFGTFAEAFPRYRDASCGSPYTVFVRAHNFFLEGLFGLGVVFVPVVLLAYSWTVAVFLRGLRNRRRLRPLPVVGLGAVLLATLHGLVDFSLQIPGMAAYFAVFLAGVTTVSLARVNSETAPPGGGRPQGPASRRTEMPVSAPVS